MAMTAAIVTVDEASKLLLPVLHDIGFPPCVIPRVARFLGCGLFGLVLARTAAARANDQLRRQNDAFGRAARRFDPPEQQIGRLLADPVRVDLDRGQGRAVMRRLRDVVEADYGAILPRGEAAVRQANEHARGADVVVTEDGGGIVALAGDQAPDRALPFRPGRQAVDDRTRGQAMARQRLTKGLDPVAGRGGAPPAPDEGQVPMAETDEMLGRDRKSVA